jgi:REP element-mobilizing transposase RayT
MRIRRGIQVDRGRVQYFHVVSRVVDRRMIFGDEEKDYFVGLVRRFERFSGLEVLAYAVMGNHFHLLLCVPVRPEVISVKEVWRRMGYIYPREKIEEFREQVGERVAQGNVGYEREFLDRMRARMYDLSSFVKDIKQRFGRWYNSNNDRKGTLWEERFRSVLVEGHENALMKTAAYIELNPVRAGIVGRVSEYRWCSWAEAEAGGGRARECVIKLVSGAGRLIRWREASAQYRSYFIEQSLVHSRGRPRHSPDLAEEPAGERDQISGHRDMRGLLVRKWRYFSEGLVLGSREFIEEFYTRNRERLNPNRRTIAYGLPGTEWGGLCSYRNVRIRPGGQSGNRD